MKLSRDCWFQNHSLLRWLGFWWPFWCTTLHLNPLNFSLQSCWFLFLFKVFDLDLNWMIAQLLTHSLALLAFLIVDSLSIVIRVQYNIYHLLVSSRKRVFLLAYIINVVLYHNWLFNFFLFLRFLYIRNF